MGYFIVTILFLASFQCAISDQNALGKFVLESIAKSVSHSVIEDFTKRLNATEMKLENALEEIKYLKARDEIITEELSRLREKIDDLYKSKSIATESTRASTTSTSVAFTTKTPRTVAKGNTQTNDSPGSTPSGCTLDVMFVLDGSASIGYANFARVKEWVKAMAARITQSHNNIQLGVMQYSQYFSFIRLEQQRYIKTEVKLDYYNDTEFASRVDRITLMGYTTYTAAALRRVKYDFLNSTNFGKSGNIQIMILITDGAASDFKDLPESAKELRGIGIVPFAVGVGAYRLNELRIIATGNESSSERVNSFADFSSLQSAIVDLTQYLDTCEVSTITVPLSSITKTPQTTTAADIIETTVPEFAISGCSLDVMFVLDGSKSIGVDDFLLVKEWVKATGSSIAELKIDMQLGVMQYSHYYRTLPLERQPLITTEVKLDYHNDTEFALKVDNITLMGYTTYTAAALRRVKYDFLSSTNFGKSGNVQVMILISDGATNDFLDLPQSAEELRRNGVVPFAVGVGNYRLNELRIIATGNESSSERVNAIKDFSGLQSAIVDLEQYLDSCKGSSTTQPITSATQAATLGNIKSVGPTTGRRLTVTSELYSSVNRRTTRKAPVTSPVNNSSCTIDVMYVLDGSLSVGVSNFSVVKQWVKSSAQHLIDQYPFIQLGVMQYSHYFRGIPVSHQTYIRTYVKLANHEYSDFASAVDKIPFIGFKTYTAAALRSVKINFANSENFNKTGNVQIMILVTDGKASDSDELDESAADLRQIGVIPFSVGVGRVVLAELRTIATGNLSSSDRVTTIPDFINLQSVRLDLTSYVENC